MRQPLSLPIYLLGAFGLFAVGFGLHAIFVSQHFVHSRDLIYFMAAFAVLSPWSVRLRSGSSWRPGMAIVTGSIFLFPPALTPLIAVPGLLLVAGMTHQPLRRYPITLGHVALSAYAGAWTYQLLSHEALNLTDALPGAIAALIAYLVINRLVAAVIVAQRDRKPLVRVVRLAFWELSWGHVSLYLLSITTALLYGQEGLPGLILSAALLVGVYQSVAYYSRANPGKGRLDGRIDRCREPDGLGRVPSRDAKSLDFGNARHDRH